MKQIAKTSSGLTRRVNLIADKALLAAFSENTHSIQPRHIKAALRDSEFGQSRAAWRPSPAFGWAALTLVIGAGLGAGLYALFESTSNPAAGAEPQATRESAPASAKAVAPVPAPAATPVVAAATRENVAPAAAPQPAVIVPPAAAATQAPTPAAGAPAVTAPAPPAAAPTSPVPQSAASESATSDVITARMHATERWVGAADPNAYSIQLFVSDDDQQLRKHLKALPKFIEVNDIYMYRSAAQGRPMVNVLWRAYADRKVAEEELALLPPSMRKSRPYVRTMSGIRAEIERRRDTGAR
jgi:septal ring-binding cell division protein DamX